MIGRILGIFVIMLLHVSAFGQKSLTVDEAIFEGMNHIAQNTPSGSKVAVLNIESENGELADYIIVECKNHISNNTFLSLSNTKKLPDILREKGIDDLSAADDKTLSQVAGSLGAEFAIQGRFLKQAGYYGLIFRVLDVGKTQIVLMQSYEVRLDEILADFTGETYNPSSNNSDNAEKEMEELRKQMRELQAKSDSAIAALEAKKNEEQATRERLEAEAEAARQARQAAIEAKKNNSFFVFSFRPEFVSGSVVMGAGASAELGIISKNSFYFTAELIGGAIYYGGGLNAGVCFNKDGPVKNVLGINAGYRDMLYIVDFTKRGEWLTNATGHNVSIAGLFWKSILGKSNNIDVTGKFLLGYRRNPVSYDKIGGEILYDEGFNVNMTYVIGIGYALTKAKK